MPKKSVSKAAKKISRHTVPPAPAIVLTGIVAADLVGICNDGATHRLLYHDTEGQVLTARLKASSSNVLNTLMRVSGSRLRVVIAGTVAPATALGCSYILCQYVGIGRPPARLSARLKEKKKQLAERQSRTPQMRALALADNSRLDTPQGVSNAIERCTDIRPVRLSKKMSWHAIAGEDQLANLAAELDDEFKLDVSTEELALLLIDEGDPTGDQIVDIIDEHRVD